MPCAIEAAPDLRINNAGKVVRWDEIMDALRMLDRHDRPSLCACTCAHRGACADGEHAQVANPIGARRRAYEGSEGNLVGMQPRPLATDILNYSLAKAA